MPSCQKTVFPRISIRETRRNPGFDSRVHRPACPVFARCDREGARSLIAVLVESRRRRDMSPRDMGCELHAENRFFAEFRHGKGAGASAERERLQIALA